MVRSVFCGALVWLAAVTAGVASLGQERLDHWHQWRGPEATGFAPHGDPPTEWSEEKNIKWKVAIPGKGIATPIVWGDRIFILTAIKTDRVAEQPAAEAAEAAAEDAAASGRRLPLRLVAFQENAESQSPPAVRNRSDNPPAAGQQPGGGGAGRGEGPGPGRGRGRGLGRFGFGPPQPPTNYQQFVVLCLDRHTGEALWQQIAADVVPHEGHHETGSYASASPVTDGQHVYCSFGSRGIYSYDMDGNRRWKADVGQLRMRFGFGEGSSPVLHGDTLVQNCDQENGSFIVALDADTGAERWRKPRDEVSTWNTPLVVEHNGRTQVIVNGQNRSRSYDLATGELIWECGGQMANPIPSPVRLGDLAICVTGFRGYAAYAIPLDSTGDVTDTDKIAWKRTEGTPYVSSPLLYGERLYYTKDRSGILSCVNARTGDVIIDQKRLPQLDDIYASPVGAAGRVYFTGRSGVTVVIDATKDEVEVLAENQLDDTIDASPAIVGKEIFLRGAKNLYCIAAQ